MLPVVLNSYRDFEAWLTSVDPNTKLLLHGCCAPCSSAVIKRLASHLDVAILFYNPNIYPHEEYHKRLTQFQKLPNVKVIELQDSYDRYLDAIKGYETWPERSGRCSLCFKMRLQKTAQYAKDHGYDCFSTTLSISPYKSSRVINAIGQKLARELEIPFIYSDFKKHDGYLESIQLSREYDLYRQEYCGCGMSWEAQKHKNK